MTEWVKATIIKIKYWTENLFSVIVHGDIDNFIAGQYTKIAIKKENGKQIQRAYSYVNPPNDKNLEFYVINIPSGQLSSKLYLLNKNDTIMISKKSLGFFTINNIPNCNNLWMLSTGTAIGPYLSILRDYTNKKLNNFNKIILIHAVRFFKDLSYMKVIKDLENYYNGKLVVKIIVSRENIKNYLTGRIPELIEKNILEQEVGIKINYNNSHFMICGNPNMVRDTQKILIKKYNMKKKLLNKKNNGHITTENYW